MARNGCFQLCERVFTRVFFACSGRGRVAWRASMAMRGVFPSEDEGYFTEGGDTLSCFLPSDFAPAPTQAPSFARGVHWAEPQAEEPEGEVVEVRHDDENGFSEAVLRGVSEDGARASVVFRDPARRWEVVEVDRRHVSRRRGAAERAKQFVAGEAVEVLWPLRCTWFSATVVEALPDATYSVEWTAGSDRQVASVLSHQLRPRHSATVGERVEVAGGDGSPQAAGSFYEGRVASLSGAHRVKVQWDCRGDGEHELVSVDEDELLRPHGHVRGDRYRVGEEVEIYWGQENSWWQATVTGVESGGYRVRWKYDYGEDEEEKRVKPSQMRRALPLDQKRRKTNGGAN